MNKEQLLTEVKQKISALPQNDIEKSLDYYSEIIDDYIEDGLSEEQAIEQIGTVDEIVSQIMTDVTVDKTTKKRKRRVWEIVLLAVASPIWLPVLIAALVVIAAVYIVIWAVVIVLYAVVVSFAAAAICGIFGGAVLLIFAQNYPQALLLFGAGLISAGIAILLFFAFNKITSSICVFTKFIFKKLTGKEQTK